MELEGSMGALVSSIQAAKDGVAEADSIMATLQPCFMSVKAKGHK